MTTHTRKQIIAAIDDLESAERAFLMAFCFGEPVSQLHNEWTARHNDLIALVDKLTTQLRELQEKVAIA